MGLSRRAPPDQCLAARHHGGSLVSGPVADDRRLWPSALVAAVFAVHPLHVESVAWVTERKDVLSGLFFVLTLAAYVRYVATPLFAEPVPAAGHDSLPWA